MTTKAAIKKSITTMHTSDIYSLMLFILYKVQDIPECALTSELCYLLDGANMTRLLTYFAGRTITIPTKEEFARVTNAMLLYNYINVEGDSLVVATQKLGDLSAKELQATQDLYIKMLPVIGQYNIDRKQLKHNG